MMSGLLNRLLFAAGVVVSLLDTSGANAQCLGWKSVLPPPGPRSGHAMAYDSARNLTILFGGNAGLGQGYVQNAETTGWNGQEWVLLSDSGPSIRWGHAMAFDSARGVTVLFGGYGDDGSGSNTYLGDTWEWDAQSWTLRATVGPSPRRGHRLAFDPFRGVTLLFGGSDGGPTLGDTWQWDGTDWTLVDSSGPARYLHAMAFDSERNRLIAHGGRFYDGSSYADLFDTWEWDGAVWSQQHTGLGLGGGGPRMAFDTARGVTVLVGSYNRCTPFGCGYVHETYEWDGADWIRVATTGPETDAYSTFDVVFDSLRSVILLYGGTYNAQMWEWNGSTWNVMQLSPMIRTDPGMAFDSARGVTVVFGGLGYDVDGIGYLGDTWEWDDSSWSDRTGPGPSERRGHAMAFDETRGVTVLFGGSTGVDASTQYFGDTWEWDGLSWALRDVPGPSPRTWHAMSYDRGRGVTVLFGGRTEAGYTSETWEWDGETWTLRTTTGPSPCSNVLMAYDSIRETTVLFWACYAPGFGSLMWEWDGTSWHQRGTGPWTADGYAMAFDSGRGVSVVSGGWSPQIDCPWASSGFVYTWEWDGASLTQRIIPGTPDRAEFRAVYDSLRQKIVTFGSGGCGWPDPSAVWELACTAPCPTPSAPIAEQCTTCAPGEYASKNRYLSFSAPLPTEYDAAYALQVTLEQMPSAADCPNVGDFSAFTGASMWVGEEIVASESPTGVFRLQSEPLFRDWLDVSGGVIQLADCNILPCARYSIEAVTDAACDPAEPSAASTPLILTTTPIWGDVVGETSSELPNGIVDFIDISACVDRFKDAPGAPPRTWCDLAGDSPTQGVNLNIDFDDISVVVDAFKGRSYPFPGPSAPASCP